MRSKGKAHVEGNGNVFWTTMSDLMLGLAIIFMTLFTLAMTGFSQNTVERQKEQVQASQEIIDQLQKVNIDAEIDEMSGDVKIADVQLFEVNSWNLTPSGKKYLDKLVPIYINTIFSKEDLLKGIDKIVIQGHTDSQTFRGASSKDDQFTKNMELSLKRANSVAEYMMQTRYNRDYRDKLQKMLIVEGRSYNDPIMVNGTEDLAKSRRVELKLEVKRWDIMEALGF